MSGRKLISLADHNGSKWTASRVSNDPQPNGIACPKCSKELVDSRPNVTLTSYPAQKNVHCPACGYVGYRVA